MYHHRRVTQGFPRIRLMSVINGSDFTLLRDTVTERWRLTMQ
jgi:hypothetical protein